MSLKFDSGLQQYLRLTTCFILFMNFLNKVSHVHFAVIDF